MLGLTEDGLVVGECKFTSNPVTEGTLANVERTAEHVRWGDEPDDATTLFALFSRTGFSDELRQAAASRDDVCLFELSDVVDAQ